MKSNDFIAVCALVIIVLIPIQPVSAKTGNDIINACPAIFDTNNASVEQTIAAIDCAGYVSGLNDMAVLLQGIFQQEAFCMPNSEGLETGQLIRVFLKWLNDNPETLHESARSLFISAMGNHFPCNQ